MNKSTESTLIMPEINKINLKSRVTQSDNINNLFRRMLRDKHIVDTDKKSWTFLTLVLIIRRMSDNHESPDMEKM